MGNKVKNINKLTIKKTPQVIFKDMGREMNCSFYPKGEALSEKIGKLSRFYDIWKNKFNDEGIPAWKDFSFEDFAGWHSNMRAMDIGGTIEDYKKNLIIGEEFAKYFGRKTFHELIISGTPMKQSTKDEYNKYLEFICDHQYCITVGSIPDKRGISQKFTWIDLPLLDNGDTVSHIITAIEYHK